MEVKAFASSSAGNCYLVEDQETRILIECGISWKKIQRLLEFKTYELSGVLISHSHDDHSHSVKDVMKAGINVYTSAETIEELRLKSHRAIAVEPLKQFEIGSFVVLPFDLQHDVQNYGYLVYSKESGKKLVFITDTYYCKYKFENVNIYMVECNYSKPIVEKNVSNGIVNKSLRQRLLTSHFSLEHIKDFLKSNDLSKVESIMLMHLSDENSDASFFKNEIEKLTGIPTRIC